LKREAQRGDLPIGVRKVGNMYEATCSNPFTKKNEKLGKYNAVEEAFNAYKQYKEDLIKQVAEIEYEAGNITKKCYQAMIDYVIEIDD
jgi:uncharacterized protein Yka (UPF0111/DUF47 family)